MKRICDFLLLQFLLSEFGHIEGEKINWCNCFGDMGILLRQLGNFFLFIQRYIFIGGGGGHSEAILEEIFNFWSFQLFH